MRRTLCCTVLSALAISTMGCASHRSAAPAAMGDLGQPAAPLSLGAGDTLGRAIYVNDLILAAAALDKSTTFTNVDVGTSELLTDR
jgi:hypothetical protein